jgi:hypothetical protein
MLHYNKFDIGSFVMINWKSRKAEEIYDTLPPGVSPNDVYCKVSYGNINTFYGNWFRSYVSKYPDTIVSRKIYNKCTNNMITYTQNNIYRKAGYIIVGRFIYLNYEFGGYDEEFEFINECNLPRTEEECEHSLYSNESYYHYIIFGVKIDKQQPSEYVPDYNMHQYLVLPHDRLIAV